MAWRGVWLGGWPVRSLKERLNWERERKPLAKAMSLMGRAV